MRNRKQIARKQQTMKERGYLLPRRERQHTFRFQSGRRLCVACGHEYGRLWKPCQGRESRSTGNVARLEGVV
jgi:hypothetical protein